MVPHRIAPNPMILILKNPDPTETAIVGGSGLGYTVRSLFAGVDVKCAAGVERRMRVVRVRRFLSLNIGWR